MGLFLDSASLYKLKGFKGKTKEALAKDASYYAALQKPGLNRYVRTQASEHAGITPRPTSQFLHRDQ